MRFVQLTHEVLRELKGKGYTVLHSPSLLINDNPTWVPVKVDLTELFDLDSEMLARISTPMKELHYLVIDDALQNIREEDLIGSVWV